MHTGGTQRNSNSRLPKNRSIVVVKLEENGNKKDQLGILQSAQCRGVKVYGSSTKSSFEGAHKASCASSTANNYHQSLKWTLFFLEIPVVFFFSVDSFAYSAVHSKLVTLCTSAQKALPVHSLMVFQLLFFCSSFFLFDCFRYKSLLSDTFLFSSELKFTGAMLLFLHCLFSECICVRGDSSSLE